MITLRPPDPAYYRRFLRVWCGADDSAPIVVLDDSTKCPRRVGEAIHVGAEWLRRQAVPRAAVETMNEQQTTKLEDRR